MIAVGMPQIRGIAKAEHLAQMPLKKRRKARASVRDNLVSPKGNLETKREVIEPAETLPSIFILPEEFVRGRLQRLRSGTFLILGCLPEATEDLL